MLDSSCVSHAILVFLHMTIMPTCWIFFYNMQKIQELRVSKDHLTKAVY